MILRLGLVDLVIYCFYLKFILLMQIFEVFFKFEIKIVLFYDFRYIL